MVKQGGMAVAALSPITLGSIGFRRPGFRHQDRGRQLGSEGEAVEIQSAASLWQMAA